MMSPTDRELVQENILMHCHLASREGIPFHEIIRRLRNYGYEVTAEETDKELRYLEGKKFILEVPRPLAPENRRYISTSEGTDYLRGRGLLL
jgi:hypothetical protein